MFNQPDRICDKALQQILRYAQDDKQEKLLQFCSTKMREGPDFPAVLSAETIPRQ
jgi:hypothetical protein